MPALWRQSWQAMPVDAWSAERMGSLPGREGRDPSRKSAPEAKEIAKVIITELWIPGRPVTKGSLTRVGDALRDTPQSKAWRRIMAGAIRDDLRRRHGLLDVRYPGPVAVEAVWWLPVPVLQSGAGDIDKLLRNLLDALSAPTKRTTDVSLCASAIVDDNQVVGVASTKFFDAIVPGVMVRVTTLSRENAGEAEAGFRMRRDRLTA